MENGEWVPAPDQNNCKGMNLCTLIYDPARVDNFNGRPQHAYKVCRPHITY